MSPKKTAKTTTALREAKKAVEKAERAHREAFRKACVALFNQYGLCLEADGDQSAHLTIKALGASAFSAEDLPE